MDEPGHTLRTTFDREAERYDRVRPAPPPELLEAMMARRGLRAGDRVLEVGCGTGQATRPLAERGLSVHALELGPALARLARHNLRDFPYVTVETTPFEAFSAPQPFDALVSVQAFHWIEVERGLELAAAALRPGGQLLLAWHQDHSQQTPFYRETDPLFARYPEPPRPTPERSVDAIARAVQTSPLFTAFERSSFPWRVRYEARNYLDLLQTYSNVQALKTGDRQSLLTDIAEVIGRYGGVVERHLESVLLCAERAQN